MSSSTAPSLTPGHTTICPLHRDVVVEQRTQPAQAHGTARVLQHVAADVGVGGMDADVEWRQTLGDDPFEIGFGEARQRGEVAVQERQPVVVVLEIQAAPHALRAIGR